MCFVAKLDSDTVQELQESDHDPEVKPGLFQGDMALNDEVINQFDFKSVFLNNLICNF